jgi:hypothetical protein
LLLGHQGFSVEAGSSLWGRSVAFRSLVLRLQLSSITRFTVGILDHALCEAPELLVQVRVVLGELRAQVLNGDFLLNFLDC